MLSQLPRPVSQLLLPQPQVSQLPAPTWLTMRLSLLPRLTLLLLLPLLRLVSTLHLPPSQLRLSQCQRLLPQLPQLSSLLHSTPDTMVDFTTVMLDTHTTLDMLAMLDTTTHMLPMELTHMLMHHTPTPLPKC